MQMCREVVTAEVVPSNFDVAATRPMDQMEEELGEELLPGLTGDQYAAITLACVKLREDAANANSADAEAWLQWERQMRSLPGMTGEVPPVIADETLTAAKKADIKASFDAAAQLIDEAIIPKERTESGWLKWNGDTWADPGADETPISNSIPGWMRWDGKKFVEVFAIGVRWPGAVIVEAPPVINPSAEEILQAQCDAATQTHAEIPPAVEIARDILSLDTTVMGALLVNQAEETVTRWLKDSLGATAPKTNEKAKQQPVYCGECGHYLELAVNFGDCEPGCKRGKFKPSDPVGDCPHATPLDEGANPSESPDEAPPTTQDGCTPGAITAALASIALGLDEGHGMGGIKVSLWQEANATVENYLRTAKEQSTPKTDKPIIACGECECFSEYGNARGAVCNISPHWSTYHAKPVEQCRFGDVRKRKAPAPKDEVQP
jgi:hypothetical protein